MKKVVLKVSLFGVLLLFLFSSKDFIDWFEDLIRMDNYSYYTQKYFFDGLQSLLFFPFVLLFSLITYKMPERIYQVWWVFAKYAIPIILMLSIYINSGVFNDPTDWMNGVLEVFLLIALYSIFTLGSLIQIYRGWRKVRKEKSRVTEMK